MQDPFFGTEPAQLLVDGEVAIEAAQVARDLGEAPADDVMLQRVHRGDDDLVAASVREREPVAGDTAVRDDSDVRRGIVAEIERVRAIHVEGGGEADVADVDVEDFH